MAADDPTTSVRYHSPEEMAFSPDGKLLAVTDRTQGTLILIDVEARKIRQTIPLTGAAAGVTWCASDQSLYVTEYGMGTVAQIHMSDGHVMRRLEVDRHPQGLALASKRELLIAANNTTDRVTLTDLTSGQPVAHVAVPREPYYVAVTPDETLAVVSNLLPTGRANDATYGSVVSLIDLEKKQLASNIPLPPGASTVRQVCISSDGQWAYVVHCVGRTSVPSTQLERGWVNTNAFSIINLESHQLLATLLLDQVMKGAADPWGVAVTRDGNTLWVALSGVHELARIDLGRLRVWLDGGIPGDHWLARPLRESYSDQSVWLRIKEDREARRDLVNDLGALYQGGFIERFSTGGQGPRGISLSPDGQVLAVAHYFSGDVCLYNVDSVDRGPVTRISIGDTGEPDLARRGEILFHDATYSFQGWLSCATCHPNEARVDAMNWDLLNDGIGNPKNNRSLLWSDRTPPMMSLGVRETMEEAVIKGVYFLRRQPEPEEAEALAAYLRSLKPLPSPYLNPDGSLSEQAQRGREIFFSEETDCTSCHAPPLYTGLETYDVGTRGALDRTSEFDTPTLVEVYRTAPYLHDGSAASLQEVLTSRNSEDQHGATSHLTPEQIDDLVAFLLSL
jgi:DNA-binding beta-propeller fold protein YncE